MGWHRYIPALWVFLQKILDRDSQFSLHAPIPLHPAYLFLLPTIAMSQGTSLNVEAVSQGILVRLIQGPNNVDSRLYREGRLLGRGTCGEVYECTQISSGAVSTGT